MICLDCNLVLDQFLLSVRGLCDASVRTSLNLSFTCYIMCYGIWHNHEVLFYFTELIPLLKLVLFYFQVQTGKFLLQLSFHLNKFLKVDREHKCSLRKDLMHPLPDF